MPPPDPTPSPDPPPAGGPRDSASPIAEDVACAGCGYNLRGLGEDARCPECGAAIAPSVEAHRAGGRRPLHLSDRRWVRKLAAGTACLFVAGLLPHLLLLALLRAQGWARYGDVIANAFAFLACWLVSAREPATPPLQDPKWTRRMLRACAAMPLLALPATLLTRLPWFGMAYLTVPASYLLYHRLASIAGRMTAGRSVRRQARALALVVPLGIVAYVAAMFDGDRFSLWRIAPPAITGLGIPAFGTYGVAVVLRWWMDGSIEVGENFTDQVAAIVASVSPIWSASFAAGATVALLRELRRSRPHSRAG